MPVPLSPAGLKTLIRRVPLFSELSATELDALAGSVRPMTVRKNVRVFDEGDRADCCFVLTAGRARVMLSGLSDGDVVIGVVKVGSLFGEIGLFNRASRSASVVAAEECNLLRVPLSAFEALRANPRFEDRLFAHVVSTLLESSEQVRMLSAPSTMTRVAGCLCRIARREGERDGATVVIPRRKHQELADMIGCSRETVSRKLDALKRRRYVTWDKHTMRLDVEGLQRYLRGELGAPGRWA